MMMPTDTITTWALYWVRQSEVGAAMGAAGQDPPEPLH
jgi:hypothetical protein